MNTLEEIGQSAIASIVELVAGLDRDSAAQHFVSTLSDERKLELYRAYFDESDQMYYKGLTADEAGESLLAGMQGSNGYDPEGFDFDEDEARDAIQEDPLSLEYRSGWSSSSDDLKAEEFCLLLSTGGPAVRIIGECEDGSLSNPKLQVQDWGTPWTAVYLDSEEKEALETYIAQFSY